MAPSLLWLFLGDFLTARVLISGEKEKNSKLSYRCHVDVPDSGFFNLLEQGSDMISRSVRILKSIASIVVLATPTVALNAFETPAYEPESIINYSKADIDDLKVQIALLQARLEDLEKGSVVYKSQVEEVDKSDSIKYKADLRYRHEGFSVESRPTRHRHRVRARFGATLKVEDNLDLTFGLASGSNDPISTNQTLGQGNSSKNVVLDLAYAQWQSPVDGLKIRAGKFSNPLTRVGGSGLVWDGDLRPEGIGLTYNRGSMFLNAMGSWLRESSSSEDSVLYSAQLGSKQAIGPGQSLRFGIGYNTISSPEPLFGEPAGNRTDDDNELISDFDNAEIFIEYGQPVDWFLSGDALLFASHVTNLGASDANTGYTMGAKLKTDGLDLGWSYQRLEADAVFGGLSDSDFIGGGTDGSGHIIQASYPLGKKVKLQGTFFINETGLESNAGNRYNRLMLDVSYKY